MVQGRQGRKSGICGEVEEGSAMVRWKVATTVSESESESTGEGVS